MIEAEELLVKYNLQEIDSWILVELQIFKFN
jgi:hypothetical protein